MLGKRSEVQNPAVVIGGKLLERFVQIRGDGNRLVRMTVHRAEIAEAVIFLRAVKQNKSLSRQVSVCFGQFPSLAFRAFFSFSEFIHKREIIVAAFFRPNVYGNLLPALLTSSEMRKRISKRAETDA